MRVAAAVALAALLAAPAVGQSPPEEEATIERALELRRELERLLATLSPEARRELERRLAVENAAPTPPAEPAAAATSGRCTFLVPFDTDGDGVVDARDRYWRYFYAVETGGGEPRSLYDLGVRGLSLDLRSFTTEGDASGDVEAGDAVVLDAGRDGLGAGRDARLAVDADALRRRGGPDLRDAAGRPLVGIVALAAGQRLVAAGGETVLGCP